MTGTLNRVLVVAALAFAWVAAGCESGVKITSISPDYGTVAGGEDVLLKGAGFKAGVQVKFCKAEAKTAILLGDTQIKVTSPANSKGTCDVTLSFDDGRGYTVKGAFRYMEPSELMKRDMLGTKGAGAGTGAATKK